MDSQAMSSYFCLMEGTNYVAEKKDPIIGFASVRGEAFLGLNPWECSWEDLAWQRAQKREEGTSPVPHPALDSGK